MAMRAIPLLVLIVGILVPTSVEAQPAVPVEKCSRDCDPKLVNGPTYKTGREPVTQFLYGHFEDILNMAPLNTQAPDPEQEPDLNRGFLMPVVDTNSGICLPGGQTCADIHFKNNEFTMFSSPGLVEYLQEGWRTHQEPQLNSDIQIAGPELVLYWYMSTAAWGQDSALGNDPGIVGVMPLVDVYARVETGRFKFQGELIAESASQPHELEHRTTMISLPGQDPVYEFKVRMPVKKNIIPSNDSGFIVHVQPYQIATAHEGGTQVAQPNWRVRTGADFPVRVLVPTFEPIKTYGSGAKINGTELRLWWNYAPDLGSYDRRHDLRTLTLNGNHTIDPTAILSLSKPRLYHGHGGLDSENSTWIIDLTKVSLPDGHYELEATVPTRQDTYLHRERFPFEVKNGQVVLPGTASFEGEAAPGVSLAVAGFAVALFLMLRRRQNP